MTVYILHRYWDTPDNEGVEVIGVYYNFKETQKDMQTDARKVRTYYSEDFWSDDMTWEEDNEIHLGFDPMNGDLATIYWWEIIERKVE